MDQKEYRQKVREHGINDEERRLWILNNEGLYNWYRSERVSLRRFICKNRREITIAILHVLN